MSVSVTLYSRPGCEHCRMVQDYLDQRGVAYEVRDVSTDSAALADLQRIHSGGVPVTVIDGDAVIGFDKIRFDDLLKAKGVTIGAPA